MVEYREILNSEQIDSIVNFLIKQKPKAREALHKLESNPQETIPKELLACT